MLSAEATGMMLLVSAIQEFFLLMIMECALTHQWRKISEQINQNNRSLGTTANSSSSPICI